MKFGREFAAAGKGRKRKMYKPVSTDLSLVEREKEVEKFWKENDIFKKSIDSRREGPVYTFYDGPPKRPPLPSLPARTGNILL